MPYPTSLAGVSDREAATDPIYRAVVGIDTANVDLFNSAFFPDAVFDLNGTVFESLEVIRSGCYDGVAKLDTTHFLTNVRLDLKSGESTATLTASALAQHYRTGTGMDLESTRLMSGSLYTVDLVRDGDIWRIKKWAMKLIWREGDWAVIGR